MPHFLHYYTDYRSSHPKVFLRGGLLKICSKFTGEHPCRKVISTKLQSKATLWKSHFGMGVRHSEHLFLGTPLGGCFCNLYLFSICFSSTLGIKIQLHLEYCSCQSIAFSSLLSSSAIILPLHWNFLINSSFSLLSFSDSSTLSLKNFIELLMSMNCSSPLIRLSFAFSSSRKIIDNFCL